MPKPSKFTPYTWLEQKRLLEAGKSNEGLGSVLALFASLIGLLVCVGVVVYSLVSAVFH